MAALTRKRVSIGGVVQGVGFRPFVWRRASRFGLAGWVENDSTGVIAEVQGPTASVGAFLEGFRSAAPPVARIERMEVADVPVDVATPPRFIILASTSPSGTASSFPPDIATCPDCLAEVRDGASRRYRYPFINCTACGPRFTIIDGLPYDRERTTMREFAMCRPCAAEYLDPTDRRFHAQPNACPACGPTVWLVGDGIRGAALEKAGAECVGEAAVQRAREMLRDGRILAIKGLGGFHLVCDATNGAAVGLLRNRKRRVGKPLAVMVTDSLVARGIARVDEQERRLLEGHERPIVLLRKRDGSTLAAGVSPGTDFVGVMLPYTPLHHLLGVGLPPLVMTSGNLSEEPIVHDNAAAVDRLAPLVDAFVMHDRPIQMACDDSVVRCAGGVVMPLRRSRGHAPLPIGLFQTGPSVLAVGGELKAAVCVVRDTQAIMSQHIGDVGNLETLHALAETADHFMRLFGVQPELVAADMHPGYLSTGWARRFAADRGLPLVQVQHHEAHVAALLTEHGRTLEGAIGVCFDGTGYGRDGAIWGGEWFAVSGGRFRRAAHLAPFSLPGGDTSIRHPWRTALALLHAAGVEWNDLPPVRAAGTAGCRVLGRQLERRLNCTVTTSMGRLFDAVASLAGVKQSITYEAEAAMNLEALVAQAPAGHDAYAFAVAGGELLQVGWHPVVREVALDVGQCVPPAVIAARFHRAVATLIADVCRRLRSQGAGETVGLTGGVFQNAALLELTLNALHDSGFEVLCHQRLPANDGGLALGQAVLARMTAE